MGEIRNPSGVSESPRSIKKTEQNTQGIQESGFLFSFLFFSFCFCAAQVGTQDPIPAKKAAEPLSYILCPTFLQYWELNPRPRQVPSHLSHASNPFLFCLFLR
jgi:hypothetical protein